MKHPQSVARATLLVMCLSLGPVSLAQAQPQVKVPIPPASLLLTADEVKAASINGAKIFPLSRNDAGWRPQARYLLPVTVVVKDTPTYPSKTGDATAQRTKPYSALADGLPWSVYCGENCSQRARQLLILEYAAPPNNKKTVFNDMLAMILTRYADPKHVAEAMAKRRRYDKIWSCEGTDFSIGNQAYLRKVGAESFSGSRNVYLEVQRGTFHLLVAVDSPSAYYEPKLRALAVSLAQMIVPKLRAYDSSNPVAPPPPPTSPRLEIVEGPLGRPNPVAPGGAVQCAVLVSYSSKPKLSYQWTATGGTFNYPQAQNPTWTAPATGSASQYAITVSITASDGAHIAASYLQKVSAAPTSSPPPPVTTTSPAAIRVYIDGTWMLTPTPPVEISGRVLVAVAGIFRELGADVVWDGGQQKLTATRGARVIQLWVGRTTALVDGSAVTLDVPPQIIGRGTTYVPVRFVAQALGAGVVYDPAKRAVLITTASMPPLTGSGSQITPPPPSAKLTVTSPANGSTVPEQFTISGTGLPGKSVQVTVIAEGTLKATGQEAKSRLLDNAQVTVGANGRWSINVNSRAVRRDQRVTLKQFSISVQMPVDGRAVERVLLTVRP
ncbi:MAG: copper amine oxidase N-terminal domain-containing protein [Armatimonadetes bacterium]|nr:copper amine oxidase N-terminal domain-containing protein [Armatimonadota bacterium]